MVKRDYTFRLHTKGTADAFYIESPVHMDFNDGNLTVSYWENEEDWFDEDKKIIFNNEGLEALVLGNEIYALPTNDIRTALFESNGNTFTFSEYERRLQEVINGK